MRRIANATVVRMRLHRGGSYCGPNHGDPAIFEGGTWTEKEGVLFVEPPHLSEGCAWFGLAWFVGFDGDIQATTPSVKHNGWPDGSKIVLRSATAEDLSVPAIAAAVALHDFSTER